MTSDRSSSQTAPASSRDDLVDIVHEDAGLLVLNKPAGLVCHPTKGDVYSSLISRVRLYLGAGIQPQLVNRLDRETSGLILIGKDPLSALALRRVVEARELEKEYLAVAEGDVQNDHFHIDQPLGKDETSLVAIKDTVRPDGAPALTELWVERRFQRGGRPFTLLRVRPHTGRKHQIRIHLSWAGHPLVGDKIYGSDERLYLAFVEERLTPEDRQQLLLPFHALHANRLRFTWGGAVRQFRAAPEAWFTGFVGDAMPVAQLNAPPPAPG